MEMIWIQALIYINDIVIHNIQWKIELAYFFRLELLDIILLNWSICT
jgi:hypothetical protein